MASTHNRPRSTFRSPQRSAQKKAMERIARVEARAVPHLPPTTTVGKAYVEADASVELFNGLRAQEKWFTGANETKKHCAHACKHGVTCRYDPCAHVTTFMKS